MKIAFVESWFNHANTVRHPRSIAHYIPESLKRQGAEVETIQPTVTGNSIYLFKKVFYKYFTDKKYYHYLEEAVLRKEAKKLDEILNKPSKDISDADFILSFGNFATSFLKTDKKIIFWIDAVMPALVDYYDYFTNQPTNILNKFIEIEKQGLQKATAVFCTSHWTMNEAIKMTNSSKNIYFAPFGANFDFEKTQEEIELSIDQKMKNETLNLLFTGYFWERKGGDIAVDIVRRLNELGRKAKLIVIGANPEINETDKNFVEIVGKVDKYSEQERFCSYFYDSHFFILPTLAECAAHTLVEANAFGLPSISHKTGGLKSIITDDVNGKLFEIGENIDNFCNYIIENFEDKEKYKALCLRSYSEYKTRLNWDYGAKIIVDTLKEIRNG